MRVHLTERAFSLKERASIAPYSLNYRASEMTDKCASGRASLRVATPMANSSFTLGMVASIADKLKAMKTERDAVNNSTGRDLMVLKASVVDAELEKLGLKLRTVRRATRMVSPTAYEPGGAAGAALAINPGIRRT